MVSQALGVKASFQKRHHSFNSQCIGPSKSHATANFRKWPQVSHYTLAAQLVPQR